MLLLYIGLTLIVYSIIMGYSSYKFLIASKSTEGIIIRINNRSSTGDHNLYVYAPVVRYTINSNNSYVHESSSYSSDKYKYRAGDTIKVYYIPSEPGYAFVGSKFGFIFFEMYILLFGLLMVAIWIYD